MALSRILSLFITGYQVISVVVAVVVVAAIYSESS